LLWRFDSRTGPNFYAIKLGKPPSQYFKDNFIVTTSGMCSPEPLNCTIAALGHERVMFAADYPFESAQEAGAFMDEVAIADPVRPRTMPRNIWDWQSPSPPEAQTAHREAARRIRSTPHVGGYIVEYQDFIMPLILDNMRLFLAERPNAMA